ncbi:hypothetical protein K505DRAFT_331526 [Melanomma pulvis-pyrius CBS 109.77]|uniref:Zn(2)-C6 fungal-type domain-containing protein n=1 Tax=Melanomma pulvis-pyrius CBS 109.77 TaxID=1314802 RepID=A0A6A6XY51_9PLEO|nr:hypothetical protein K505DRAFT_331526 [Melanomma pulvis-pyrius CBS 109.77]
MANPSESLATTPGRVTPRSPMRPETPEFDMENHREGLQMALEASMELQEIVGLGELTPFATPPGPPGNLKTLCVERPGEYKNINASLLTTTTSEQNASGISSALSGPGASMDNPSMFPSAPPSAPAQDDCSDFSMRLFQNPPRPISSSELVRTTLSLDLPTSIEQPYKPLDDDDFQAPQATSPVPGTTPGLAHILPKWHDESKALYDSARSLRDRDMYLMLPYSATEPLKRSLTTVKLFDKKTGELGRVWEFAVGELSYNEVDVLGTHREGNPAPISPMFGPHTVGNPAQFLPSMSGPHTTGNPAQFLPSMSGPHTGNPAPFSPPMFGPHQAGNAAQFLPSMSGPHTTGNLAQFLPSAFDRSAKDQNFEIHEAMNEEMRALAWKGGRRWCWIYIRGFKGRRLEQRTDSSIMNISLAPDLRVHNTMILHPHRRVSTLRQDATCYGQLTAPSFALPSVEVNRDVEIGPASAPPQKTLDIACYRCEMAWKRCDKNWPCTNCTTNGYECRESPDKRPQVPHQSEEGTQKITNVPEMPLEQSAMVLVQRPNSNTNHTALPPSQRLISFPHSNNPVSVPAQSAPLNQLQSMRGPAQLPTSNPISQLHAARRPYAHPAGPGLAGEPYIIMAFPKSAITREYRHPDGGDWLHFEAEGSLPLIEGVGTDINEWKPWINAFGKGEASMVIRSQTEM